MRTGPLMKAPRQYLARGATAEGKVVGAEDGGAMDAAMDWLVHMMLTHMHMHCLRTGLG